MARARRPAHVFNAAGVEVLITLTCLKCGSTAPLERFGLRLMADGKVRNCPWWRTCRSGCRRRERAPSLEAA